MDLTRQPRCRLLVVLFGSLRELSCEYLTPQSLVLQCNTNLDPRGKKVWFSHTNVLKIESGRKSGLEVKEVMKARVSGDAVSCAAWSRTTQQGRLFVRIQGRAYGSCNKALSI